MVWRKAAEGRPSVHGEGEAWLLLMGAWVEQLARGEQVSWGGAVAPHSRYVSCAHTHGAEDFAMW